MPCTRQELEDQEKRNLAPCAQFSAESRGRKHSEPPPEWRTQYQRDRDRVIHSRAFRRLEYKTQVFLNGSGDHLRTRLTHTMEVAAIARNIARALRLNEDLAEAIALAHDLGHSPIGHKGEAALNRLMKDHGGFEHNRQSLRIVEELEEKYPGFPGLNLSFEVREGLMKHFTAWDNPESCSENKTPSLEAQVANVADEIAYYSHDLDDGLESALLSEDELCRAVPLWMQAAEAVRDVCKGVSDECRRYFIIRCLIDGQVRDVVLTTEQRIQEAGVCTVDEVRRYPKTLVHYSPDREKQNRQLRAYLYENLYHNPVVHEPNARAVLCIERLFDYFLSHLDEIGGHSRRRLEKVGAHRAVCDYLAGMTDRYVFQEYERIFGPIEPAFFPRSPQADNV